MKFLMGLGLCLVTSHAHATLFAERLSQLQTQTSSATSNDYQVHIRVNSQGLVDGKIVPTDNDPGAQGGSNQYSGGTHNEIAARGDLRLELIDTDQSTLYGTSSGKIIRTIPSASGLPIFDITQNFSSDLAHTSVLVRLVNADGYWLAPWTWGFLSDMRWDIVQVSLSTKQVSSLKSFFVSTHKLVIAESTSSNQVRVTTTQNNQSSSVVYTSEQYLQVEASIISGLREAYLIELSRQ